MRDYQDWFDQAYDRTTRFERDGIEIEKIRDTVAHRYADAVETGEIDRHMDDLVAEGRALFNRYVMPTRERRSNSLRKEWQYILDALEDKTILGRDDPRFAQAFRLGNGRDKTLRYWGVDDIRGVITERYRGAASTMKAASADDSVGTELIDAMVGLDAQTIEGLLS